MIHLGDGVSWLEAQGEHSLDGIFTDPPWGVKAVKIKGNTGQDVNLVDQYVLLTTRVLIAAERVLKPHGHVLLWFAQTNLDPILRHALPRTHLHWNAILTVEIMRYSGYRTLDPILVFGRKQFARPRGLQRPLVRTFYRAPHASHEDSNHPCGRPLATVGEILRDWFKEGDVICDPFAGSDTTGAQSSRLGITCHSWEIDPAMFKIAEERHAQKDLFEEATT